MPQDRTSRLLALLFGVALAAAGCSSPSASPSTLPAEGPQPTEVTRAPALFPPDRDMPAAGICAVYETDVVTIEIVLEGPPTPRCVVIAPSQRLEVINRTTTAVEAGLAQNEFALQPHETRLIDRPFGAYLAPGVHNVRISRGAGSAPELWLQAD
jgi:hypothetical protein